MEYLEVIDSPSEMCGTRKCYLGPRCMDDIGLKLADWVKIQTKCCSFMCVVWPRRDRAEGYIQFDPTILHGGITELCSKCLIENSKKTQLNFAAQKVEKIESEKLNSVTVSVIFEDYRDVIKYRKLTSSDDLKRKLSSVLWTMCVCEGSVVKCQRLNLGKLQQISYIVINKISGKVEYCVVAAKTKFKIEHISSKDRFEQKVKRSSGKKVGGLSREKDILIDTITLPFKYPNAQQKLGIQFNRGVLLRGPAGCGKTSLVRYDTFFSGYICYSCGLWINGVLTLSETENDFCSKNDKMAKNTQCDWLLLAISSVSLRKSFSVSLSVKTP